MQHFMLVIWPVMGALSQTAVFSHWGFCCYFAVPFFVHTFLTLLYIVVSCYTIGSPETASPAAVKALIMTVQAC